jgi:hypothetical protein
MREGVEKGAAVVASTAGSHFVPVSYSRETAQSQRLQHFTGTQRFPTIRERAAFGSKHCDAAWQGQERRTHGAMYSPATPSRGRRTTVYETVAWPPASA